MLQEEGFVFGRVNKKCLKKGWVSILLGKVLGE